MEYLIPLETPRISSGFPGCTRDEGTAMNSVFNSITSVVLTVHAMLNVVNSINNNNNNNDNNNNNNDNNNVFSYGNNFVNMNMNTAEVMMVGVPGRRRKRQIRAIIYDIFKQITLEKDSSILNLYSEILAKKLYQCML